jgi:hypothetical protein
VPLSLVPKLAWAARVGRPVFVELFRLDRHGRPFLNDTRDGVARRLVLVSVSWPEARA